MASAALHGMIEQLAIRRGDFTLSSGKKSSYFIDLKQVMLYGMGATHISLGFIGLCADILRQRREQGN
jgi:orotate phosphoribosyltransferase